MGTDQNKQQDKSKPDSTQLEKLVEVGSYSRLTQQNLKKSMQTVFPDKPGESYVTFQDKKNKKVETVKLAGLTDKENKQLNFILSGQTSDE